MPSPTGQFRHRALAPKLLLKGWHMAHKIEHAAQVAPHPASHLALELSDEFSRLKEAHQAQACVNGLLSPQLRPAEPEEFNITPEDLRALLRVIQGEVERRASTVEAMIGGLRRALSASGVG